MSEKEKMGMLEEMLEVETGNLRPDMLLSDVEEWDSVIIMSFIVMLDEEFEREISGKEIKEFKTIQDVLNVMEKKSKN